MTPRWSGKLIQHDDRPTRFEHNLLLGQLTPQGPTNQPTNTSRIKAFRCFDGVAGDFAAGVFNPATPQGAVLERLSYKA